MKNKKICHNRPYLEGFDQFIIKKLRLLPNYYTQNEFLFFKKGLDVNVAYAPRCQLLDFGPPKNENSFNSNYYSKETYQELSDKVKRFWEDISLDYFLEYGIVLDNYITIRLYGVEKQSWANYDDVPWVTNYSNNNYSDFAEVENWMEVSGKKYLKNKYFQYSYWGTEKKSYKAPSNKLFKSAPQQKRLNYILKNY